MTHPCNQTLYWLDLPVGSKMTQTEMCHFPEGTRFLGQGLDIQKGSGSVLGWGQGIGGKLPRGKTKALGPGNILLSCQDWQAPERGRRGLRATVTAAGNMDGEGTGPRTSPGTCCRSCRT